MAMVIDAPIVKNCGDCIGYNRCKGWTDEPYSCPVIGEIPDKHGDLIDRDKFLEKAKKRILRVTMTDKEGNAIAVKEIPYTELFSELKNEPVVLEASK